VKVKGQYSVDVPQQQVYEALLDPEILARTLPGCESLEPIADNQYRMKMKLAVAGVQGLFEGKVSLEDQRPPESYRLRVGGQGKIGFVNGNGRLTLRSSDPSTTVIEYEGDVKVGGLIAGVGQRLMDMTTKMMIKRFFTSLSRVLAENEQN
jgi:carbon monoxide dehydrogenase subunit G